VCSDFRETDGVYKSPIAQRISAAGSTHTYRSTLAKSLLRRAMASQASNVVRPSDAELLQAQANLWWVSLSYLTPMSLRCAVELGIPTAIHRHGRAASPTDLIPALSPLSAKLPFLRRLLRLLPVRACSPSRRPRRRRGTHQPRVLPPGGRHP